MHQPSSRHRSLSRAALFLLPLGLAVPAQAQTGVSDDRVSLPDGPGSVDGMGDNSATHGNMGYLTHSVPIKLPEAHRLATPSLSLSYSSGGGSSPLGIGWSLSIPTIGRMTERGLPRYVTDDVFVADGSTELVRISDAAADPAVFRARYEGGFVRYRWYDFGTGDEGYWTAEDPNGTVHYFGADATGGNDENSRQRSPGGVFRYLLNTSVDKYGHAIEYDYQLYGSLPLIDAISYGFVGGTADNVVTFDYEAREDAVSDATGGFNEVLAHRLTAVHVFSSGEEIRTYEVIYDAYADAGGRSRVKEVRQYGADGTLYPAVQSFGYTESLGAMCDGVDCEAPYLVDMGSLGIDLQAGNATLFDINGDSLPDVLETPPGQPHRFHLAELDAAGVHSFAAPITTALGAATSGHELASAYTEVLDYNGDGFTDLVNAATGEVLVGDGGGDWQGVIALGGSGTGSLPDFGEDFGLDGDTDLTHIRFLDYDGDRLIDVMRADDVSTSIFRNLGDNGYEQDLDVQALEAGFAADNVELADLNGDGLLDPTILRANQVSFRLNLGYGRWAAWTDLDNAPVGAADLDFASLEDLNGDGIDDLVIVVADEVRYALNRNGAGFDPVVSLTAAGGVAVPTRDATTTVLFADMNANGSNDIVWVSSAGDVTYLELFPVRPNLLTRIENGLGMVVEAGYSSSVQQRSAVDGVGWTWPNPTPVLVVDSVDSWADLGDPGLERHNVRSLAYAGGYYDTELKQFRGFEEVTVHHDGDETQESLTVRTTYDVGADGRRAFAGLPLLVERTAEGGPLSTSESTWALCDLDGIPAAGLRVPIEWACRTAMAETLQEGRPSAEWVRLETAYAYDGYGNEVRSEDRGVVAIGGAACGASCTGDELITETDFIDPPASGRWLVGLAAETRIKTSESGRVAITRTYYDGGDFTGLPLGQVERGNVSRVERVVDAAGATIDEERLKYDDHGNVVESLTPLGTPGSDGHKSRFTFTADGLDMLREEVAVTGAQGTYWVQRDYTYEDRFGFVETSTEWHLEGESTTGRVTTFGYDEFGRIAAIARPGGDTLASPTQQFTYELGLPLSRVLKEGRSESGGALDLAEVTCLDGLGRMVQTRQRIAEGRWMVEESLVHNRFGSVVRDYQPFEDTSGACSFAATGGVRYTETVFDGSGRPLRVTQPDGEERGTASTVRHEYPPLAHLIYDELDNDDGSDAFDTPTRISYDGLYRPVSTERAGGSSPTRVDLFYDDLGMLAGFADADGNQRSQTRNLLGRIVQVDDPDRGTVTYEHDAAGNLVREEMANGRVTVREYDDLSRKVAEYEEGAEAATRVELLYDDHPDCPDIACANGAMQIVGARYPLGDYGDGEEAFSYDARGRAVQAVRRLGTATFRMETSYDNVGRVRSETYPGGITVENRFDGMGRLTGIPGVLDALAFTEQGPLSSYTFANGVTTTFDYDDRTLLKSVTAPGVLGLGYTRDRLGHITEITDTVAAAEGPTSAARFEYDELARLARAVLDPGGAGEETIDLEYDAIERLVDKTSTRSGSPAHVGALGYGSAHPQGVTSAGGIDFSYDSSGFVTTRGDDEFERDRQGRVTGISRGGADLTRYAYSATGTRVVKTGEGVTFYPFPGFEVRDGVGRLLLHLDNAPVVEWETAALAADVLVDSDDDGQITAADAWAQRSTVDLRTTLRGAARTLLLGEGGEAKRFLHADLLGSVVAVTDDDGAVTERLSYTPFGSVLASTAVQTEDARYASREVERETGYVDFGLRMYSPREGRFLSPDPTQGVLTEQSAASAVDAATSYAYARNNPTSGSDVSGASPEGWATFAKWASRAGVALTAAGAVAATVFVSLAISAGTFGISNLVGAIVGGVVGFGAEMRNQYAAAKQRLKESGVRNPSFRQVMGNIGWKGWGLVGIKTLGGTASGAITSGISAGFTVAQLGVKEGYRAKKIGPKTALAASVLLGVGNAIVGSVDALEFGGSDTGMLFESSSGQVVADHSEDIETSASFFGDVTMETGDTTDDHAKKLKKRRQFKKNLERFNKGEKKRRAQLRQILARQPENRRGPKQ